MSFTDNLKTATKRFYKIIKTENTTLNDVVGREMEWQIVDKDGKIAFISSNKKEVYHMYKMFTEEDEKKEVVVPQRFTEKLAEKISKPSPRYDYRMVHVDGKVCFEIFENFKPTGIYLQTPHDATNWITKKIKEHFGDDWQDGNWEHIPK